MIVDTAASRWLAHASWLAERYNTSVVPAELGGAVDAVRRWLSLGRGVLVTGDAGSGKSTVLSRLAAEATQHGAHVVHISATAPLAAVAHGALLAHEIVTGERSEARAPALLRLLDEELRGSISNIVVVDDLELLDAASLIVVDRLARRDDVLVVVSAHRGALGAAARDFIADRRVAEVRLAPLGFWGMSSLLSERLGGPAEANLISSAAARSAGNPAVAAALIDAARFSGVIALVDGLWTETGSFDTVPHDMVVPALTRRLTPEAVAALETLAWTGPVTFDDAVQLVGPDVLAALGEQERVTVYRSSRGDTVTVSPPALSHALRARMDDVRRRLLARNVEEVFGAAYEAVPAPHSELVERLVASRHDDPAHLRWAAELAALVHERAAVQDASRRADWRAEPSVTAAVNFIDSLMARPEPEQLDEIFTATPILASDPGAVVATFRSRQAQWLLWQNQDLAAATSFLREHAHQLGPAGEVLEAQALMFEISWGTVIAEEDTVQRLRLSGPNMHAQVWSVLARAGLLLEHGRAEQSLQLLDDGPQPADDSPLKRYTEAARSDALLLLGRVDEAEQWARGLLEESYDALDPLGIRVHSLKLAEVLYLTGNPDAAWQVLATSLRLGPPSPFGIAYYERTLALGAVLRADAGDVTLARVLEGDLAEYPLTYRPVLGSMRAWAQAAILYADGDATGADDLLYEQAVRDRSRRSLASALLCLSSRRSPLDPQRAEELCQLYEQAPLPLFEPIVRLHWSLACGTEDDIMASLRSANSEAAAPLSLAALDVLDQRRREHGRAPLTPAEIEELTHSSFLPRQGEAGAGAGELSEREREVAFLAKAGLSNRDIAGRLFLSVRTVENHMYRVLKKLGLDSRADLRTWAPE